MRPYYNYDSPRSGPNWTDRLKEPPLSYMLILLAIALVIFLLIRLPEVGARILILLIAFPIHELAHAMTAYRLGDVTPKLDGRLTLNPFAHLDLFGSLLILAAGLGWAKPVRFNPGALRTDPRIGAMIVAAAGPLSNLALGILMAGLWRIGAPALGLIDNTLLVNQMANLFITFALINIGLFFFNLIPLAPLDGFTVLRGLLPSNLARLLERIQPFSFLIFLVLFLFGHRLPIFGLIVWAPAQYITRLLFGL